MTQCYITNHSPEYRDKQLPEPLSIERNYHLQLPHIEIAIREWGPKDGYPIIALHGWLDNLASYIPLVGDANWLIENNFRFIAMDSAGHGHSSHRPKGQSYAILDYVDDLHQLTRNLELSDKPILLGHSMGGGIATIYAGTEVAKLAGLILIESLGPYSNEASNAAEQLSKHLAQKHRHQSQKITTYEDIREIVKLRTSKSDLSEPLVELLVRRSMKQTPEGYQWRSDPRLRVPSAMYLSHQQVEAFVADIDIETLIIYAEDGPWPNYPVLGERAELLKNKQVIGMTGGHHLHMTNQSKVRKKIIKYIDKTIN